ncbi:hypothetical protein EVAR_86085_1 [Eumeta japonica]|uniref:Uncharacterized protein n=1 Tax=Eumeta variegata TaxID=151549 RepID=A0A4C1V0H3_EUMVA|nr:hypothetical protein EVAR_86085_1 [Eumeta japonica]
MLKDTTLRQKNGQTAEPCAYAHSVESHLRYLRPKSPADFTRVRLEFVTQRLRSLHYLEIGQPSMAYAVDGDFVDVLSLLVVSHLPKASIQRDLVIFRSKRYSLSA